VGKLILIPDAVSTDAGSLDQLIAFTGRNPRLLNPGGDCHGEYGEYGED
jgi:hypothetical protein